MCPSKNSRHRKQKIPIAQKKRMVLMQKVAKERIEYLMEESYRIHCTDPELANKYLSMARKIAMGAKVRFPLKYRKNVCHGCKKLLIPGNTMRYRLHRLPHYGTYLTVTCTLCGHITRYIVKGRARSLKISQKIPQSDD